MIDAVHLLFVEVFVQQAVQHLRGFDVLAEGFFHHDAMLAARPVQARLVEIIDHRTELGGLDREIENDVGAAAHFRGGQRFLEFGVIRMVVQFSLHISKALGELVE